MRVGKIISLENGPQRDVEILISKDSIYSEVSDPPGVIRPKDVVAIEMVDQHTDNGVVTHMSLRTRGSGVVKFYAGESTFDIVLLLDALESVCGMKPRTWRKYVSRKRKAQ
jgi:hypothetical protein